MNQFPRVKPILRVLDMPTCAKHFEPIHISDYLSSLVQSLC
jgi:hypothetical protein